MHTSDPQKRSIAGGYYQLVPLGLLGIYVSCFIHLPYDVHDEDAEHESRAEPVGLFASSAYRTAMTAVTFSPTQIPASDAFFSSEKFAEAMTISI